MRHRNPLNTVDDSQPRPTTGKVLLIALLSLVSAYVPAAFAEREAITVVTSFSILADMVRNIGTDRVQVHSLVGAEADAHVYTPTPGDARRIKSAHLVLVNGLEFEGWITRLIESSGYRGPVVTASQGISLLHTDDAHRTVDPHAWQSLANARIYVDNIERGLAHADPEGAAHYRRHAHEYRKAMIRLEDETRRRLAAIPRTARRVITTHDAFGYFGRDYGVDFIHLLGLSTDEEASAHDIATLIHRIRSERIRALFVESITDPRLLQQIARDAGASVGGTLYSDALSGPQGPASTFIEMFRYNVGQLIRALAAKD